MEMCRVDLIEAVSRYKTMEGRRRFIAALGATALTTPLHAFAQQTPGKVPRIGALLFNSPRIDPVAPLIEGLRRSPQNWCSSNPI